MDTVKNYDTCNLVRPKRPDSPDENNLSAPDDIGFWGDRAVASLPPEGAVGSMRARDCGSFIPNVLPAAYPSGSGNFDSVSAGTASVCKVTLKTDKPLIEDLWYQKENIHVFISDLEPKKYLGYLFQEGIINRDEMESFRTKNITRKDKALQLIELLQKKYQNPVCCDFNGNSVPATISLKKKHVLDVIYDSFALSQTFLQEYLNKDYLKTRNDRLKSNTSSSNQGPAPVDMRNAQYAAAGQRYAYTGQTRQACEHEDQESLKKGSGKINNEDNFPVQEMSVPQLPSSQPPLRFFP